MRSVRKTDFSRLKVKPGQKLFGVVGWPLGHTLSPEIHNPLFRKIGWNANYLVLEVRPEDFGAAFVADLKEKKFGGFNITLPYKREVMRYLDGCDPHAEKIGAVNTVVNRKGKFIGYNTDDPGFYHSLGTCFPGFSLKDKNVLILGAGGAAFGAAWACLTRGCRNLVIANRTVSKADTLKANLKKTGRIRDISVKVLTTDILDLLPASLRPDLIVNAASYGLKGEKKSLITFKGASDEACVMDLIYNPPDTAFLKEARKAGLRSADGLAMLVHQGLEAFRIWTGKLPDSAPVEKRLRRILANRA
jgi:shikimate dehydrogenase